MKTEINIKGIEADLKAIFTKYGLEFDSYTGDKVAEPLVEHAISTASARVSLGRSERLGLMRTEMRRSSEPAGYGDDRPLNFMRGEVIEIDAFRKEYRALNPDETQALGLMKGKAEEMLRQLNGEFQTSPESPSFIVIGDPRCMSLAKTKLEEAVMWATKGITG